MATTYYVDPTGNDTTGNGSIGNPWATLQRAFPVAGGSVVVAGDTVTVNDGTYTDTNGDGHVLLLYNSAPQGSSGNYITIKSTNHLGAKLTVPGINSNGATPTSNSGIFCNRNYYKFQGFEISGGTSVDPLCSHAGIMGYSGSTGCIIEYNYIHDIARTVCSAGSYGNDGILLSGAFAANTGTIIRYNVIARCGRLRLGESSCASAPGNNPSDNHDHGIYVEQTVNTLIDRNLIYDCNRGYCIHVYKSGGTTTGLKIYHNTLVGKSTTGLPVGQIMLSQTVTNCEIKNNISYGAQTGMVNYFALTATNIVVSYNLTDTAINNGAHSGVTYSNTTVGSPGLVDLATVISSPNFKVAAGSAAIGAGTSLAGYSYNGTPDVGCYETPTLLTKTVEDGAASVIVLTFDTDVFAPLLPATGITGFTSKRNGGANVITSAVRSGNDKVLLTLTTPIVNGDTVLVSYSAGNLTDSTRIGNTSAQPFAFTLSDSAVTNNVTAGDAVPAQVTGLTVTRL